ncbi:MAG: DUF4293 domain-containing protein [Dysgonamonadaceae bacterium]|jgi:hypothetical protein|nr:DUF4293 domain-containing protein [Dysgonamonadaceae bacterium]
MIQRIQSVYLLLIVAVTAIASFFAWPVHLFSTVFGAASLFALITIFLYKNRKVQVKFTYTLIFLAIVFLLFGSWILYKNFVESMCLDALDYAPFFIVSALVMLIFASLALRAIKKDEKLVRSLDRIR